MKSKLAAKSLKRKRTTTPAKRTGTGPFPVVGIGASAGGYESFAKFLQELPVDSGMAYVLVQHLDPKHESKLAELLSRATLMPVIEVKNALKVEPNHVYVIPPNKNLVIVGGHLKLSPRRKADLPPMPVDIFLRSLAKDQRQNAVGVIFSGNGSDGTLGLEAIKGADGITFAQDPKTAKYTGMPDSAIATGCVDFILPPEHLARELAKLSRHRYPPPTTDKGGEAPAEPSGVLEKIYSMLRSASGVDFTHYKQSTLKRRIQRRMAVHRIEKLEDYLNYLHSHPEEVGALFDDALITVTRFFREQKSFQLLVKKVFPMLVNGRARGLPIRIWVPGCSSGEETYSIAMGLTEFLGERGADCPMQIFGTDISETAIARARAGIYRGNIAPDVSPERLRRFFSVTDDNRYRIAKSIRDTCVFARQNVFADPPFSKMDLISCQNLLIYFGPDLQRRVIPVFHYALQPGGFLLLSPAESVGEFSELFTPVDRQQRLYAKTLPLAKSEATFMPRPFAEKPVVAPMPESPAPEAALPNLEKVADDLLLQHYAPGGVIIDSKMQVLHFRGYTAPYLSHAPGIASLNLLKLVHPELALPLRTATADALKRQVPVTNEITWTKANHEKQKLNIVILPFKVPPGKQTLLLVLFEEGRLQEPLKETTVTPGQRLGVPQQVELKRLRDELAATRESFQSAIEEQEATYEELKSANEEIQSNNEELQSTNEELETAKEEMQSTNEELETVNEELRHANLEATSVNNDLINLLASVQIPVVMVDSSLRIRRFTPAAQKFFSLIPTDVGRSLSDIKANFEAVELDKMILGVIETLHLRESEVCDHAGRWHLLRIRPYRTKENKIDGAVVALFDVDQLKRSLEQITDLIWSPFLALDRELHVVRANEAFYKMFRVAREETEGRFIYELGNGQWNIPRLRVLLEELLPHNTVIKDFLVAHEFPKIGPRKMRLNARRLSADESRKEMILLAIQDLPREGKNWQ